MKNNFKSLTSKQKNALLSLLQVGGNEDVFLAYLSSEFSEEDEKEFKSNYGVTFEEARKLINVLHEELKRQLK